MWILIGPFNEVKNILKGFLCLPKGTLRRCFRSCKKRHDIYHAITRINQASVNINWAKLLGIRLEQSKSSANVTSNDQSIFRLIINNIITDINKDASTERVRREMAKKWFAMKRLIVIVIPRWSPISLRDTEHSIKSWKHKTDSSVCNYVAA